MHHATRTALTAASLLAGVSLAATAQARPMTPQDVLMDWDEVTVSD